MRERRQALIQKIHIAKGQLGMADDDYRAILRRHGAESSKDMSVAQLASVLNELIDKGWRPAAPKSAGREPKVRPGRKAQLAKIEALLADKASRQGHAVPWSYAEAIAKRVCGVERLEWCDARQLAKVIAALQYDKRR